MIAVSGFGGLVDQGGGGDVPDPAAGPAAAVPNAINRWVFPAPESPAARLNPLGAAAGARTAASALRIRARFTSMPPTRVAPI